MFISDYRMTLILFGDQNSFEDIMLSNRLEITLSHPRTAVFKKASFEKQREIYYNIYIEVVKYIRSVSSSTEDVYRYELSSDGNMHFHAYIDFNLLSSVFSVKGLVTEVVKRLVFAHPKRTHQWLARTCYDAKYRSWRMPCCCVQYIDKRDEITRVKYWNEYIDKEIKK